MAHQKFESPESFCNVSPEHIRFFFVHSYKSSKIERLIHDVKLIFIFTEHSKNLTLLAIQTLRLSISVLPCLSDLRIDAHLNIFLSFTETRRDCICGNGIRVRSLSSWNELPVYQYVFRFQNKFFLENDTILN